MTTDGWRDWEGPSGQSAPRALIGQIDVDDVSLWEETTAPWELMARPLDAACPFANCKVYLVTPSVVLYWESFSSCLSVHGLTPARMLTLSVPLRTGPRTAYWRALPVATRLPISMPGGLDVVVDTGQVHLILLVSLALLRRDMPEDGLWHLLEATAQRSLTNTPSKLNRFCLWLLGALAEAKRRPEAFRHAAVVHSFEQELLVQLAEVGAPASGSHSRGNAFLRRRGLEKALEYLRATDPSMVTVADLCRVAGVSERTLRYAFGDAVGLSPLSFIRHRRLHAARHELLAVDPGEERVADIAHRLGFLELGRFASDYRRLFGELPSQTLARPSAQRGTPLVFA